MKKGAFLVILALFILGCELKDDNIQPTPKEDPTDIEEEPDKVDIETITPEICEEAGGSWNECGSPCAGTNAEVCIQMCSAQCECGGIAGFTCPDGYKCRLSGKVADEIGVCVNT